MKKKNKGGRTPDWKCTICGRFISYEEYDRDEVIKDYIPTHFDYFIETVVEEELYLTHKKCLDGKSSKENISHKGSYSR